MVLQRNDTVLIWGKARPFSLVKITFRGDSYLTIARWDKTWQIHIPAGQAGGPEAMVVNSRVIRDIYVGDVWLMSGQSNMAYPMDSVMDLYQTVRDSTFIPAIHHFKVSTWTPIDGPKDDQLGTNWSFMAPSEVGNWSALAYFFALKLYSETGIPQGIINASQGGSDITGWMTLKALRKSQPQYIDSLKDWPGDKTTFNAPSSFYNGMIAPMQNWKLSGIVWYQGETNVDRPHEYESLLTSFICDWRELFGKKLPFALVQIHNYNDPVDYRRVGWPIVQEAQRRVSAKIPNTVLIQTKDISPTDSLHPHRKREVGERAADSILLLRKASGYSE